MIRSNNQVSGAKAHEDEVPQERDSHIVVADEERNESECESGDNGE
jgi:hypothetical protein